MEEETVAVTMSCECCGLEEECTGEYIGGVRAYFGGRWLCGLCSEAVKYEAGKSSPRAPDVEEAVRAHMAFCRMLKRGGPAERVAEGMCQMLRTASGKQRRRASSSSSSSGSSSPSPRAAPEHHHRAASTLSIQLI
ncbi:hypothetical protein E2562_035272 [Oryza meyeriana var. granulata]|uniref:DUF1677 family protein n=1 Tax=Oryza meyeriana var. granulata TaxID=110450 RepID=A0A6G1F1M2_9ORYZ|nr:hypothetical protein E2562_035272 [Oryza meyeriana var. granulata]